MIHRGMLHTHCLSINSFHSMHLQIRAYTCVPPCPKCTHANMVMQHVHIQIRIRIRPYHIYSERPPNNPNKPHDPGTNDVDKSVHACPCSYTFCIASVARFYLISLPP